MPYDMPTARRVNQLAYESGLPMRAYFLATGSQSGAKFTVKNSDGETSRSAAVDFFRTHPKVKDFYC